MRKTSVNLRRALWACAVLGVTAGSSLIAAAPAIAAPGAVAASPSRATTMTITKPMTLVRVTGLVKAAPSRTGQAEVRLADGEVIPIPAADVARVLARARDDAHDAAAVPAANCGTSYVKLQEKPDDHPVQITTGFTVIVPAISYHWKVHIAGPDKYAAEYTASGGLAFRKSWNGTYDSPADEPQGDYTANVDKTSDAVLSTGGVCHSVGPSAKELLKSPDAPVSWALSTKGASALVSLPQTAPTTASSGSTPSSPGSGKPGGSSQLSPDSVIGKDTRKRVTNTTAYPYRAIALLKVTFARGAALCTGFLYAPNIVATAGHCLYSRAAGRATKVQVIPGNNATAKPYGTCAGTTAYSVTGWMNSQNGLYDYAAVKLNCNIGTTVGWYGLYWTTGSLTGTVTITGYPGDKNPPMSMWTASGKIASAAQRQITYPISTAPGQSGAPVYRAGCGNFCAVAIHTQGVTPTRPKENAGTRITQAAFDNLKAWGRRNVKRLYSACRLPGGTPSE